MAVKEEGHRSGVPPVEYRFDRGSAPTADDIKRAALDLAVKPFYSRKRKI